MINELWHLISDAFGTLELEAAPSPADMNQTTRTPKPPMSEMGGYGGGGYGGGGYGGYGGGGGGYGGFGGGGSNPFHSENMCCEETCELKLLTSKANALCGRNRSVNT